MSKKQKECNFTCECHDFDKPLSEQQPKGCIHCQPDTDIWEEFDLLIGEAPKGSLKYDRKIQIKQFIKDNFVEKKKVRELECFILNYTEF